MPSTARERARAQMTADIKAAALAQMAAAGPAGLSLRAVARDLGVVSSALYRYFPSRDHLLTALIIDAYGDLADHVDAADGRARARGPAARWVAVCTALRRWALAEPHRFALLYGTPVADYAAPTDTIAPAVRVMRAFVGVVADGAVDDGDGLPAPTGVLADQLAGVAATLGPTIPPARLARAVGAVAQVVGLVTLELGGHFVGGFEPADGLFERCAADLAAVLGLRGS